MYCITIPVFGTGRQGIAVHFPNIKMAIQLCQSTHSGPHGPNRASFFMNPMYSIARTRQCPRKFCSPRQPMAAYMWNGLQPVTSFTLRPNPNPNPNHTIKGRRWNDLSFSVLRYLMPPPTLTLTLTLTHIKMGPAGEMTYLGVFSIATSSPPTLS